MTSIVYPSMNDNLTRRVKMTTSSSSFSQWFEEKKNPSGTTNKSNNDEESLLPLFVTGSAKELQDSVSSSFNGLKSSFEAQFPSRVCGMSYPERFRMFCALLLLAALFFILGFAVGLPLITIRPQKFALCFTFGSLTFMSSFAILKGPYEHLTGMIQRDRLLFTVVYATSMLATLWFTMNVGGASGYIMVLTSSAFQIVALLWYLISFIPGGASGLHILLAALAKMLRPVFIGCSKLWAKCIQTCISWIMSGRE